ncbi:glutathione-dependent formaldehyde-activating enzyme family protein [Methyloversatilis sp. RAC08]|uniref:GFA family protein n=1 Tax=Methyloversatilis sp. RAC08 TaxID=1842540 RepID=UPI0008573E7C|nr:GFA family protein [Methyloversatilis sp. RAC08]AOF81735.1 glutathione-dependent formaldehyde-activating enzyme family protein [Methyloversatilis sp. RAC08]
MNTPFSGGCSCGAIRYTCSAKPLFSWNCHCRDCQRASGSAYCPVMYVSKGALTISGPEPRYASLHAESGRKVSRGLCAACGSNLFILADLVPDMQGVWAGSLDDPEIFWPQINVWTRSAPAWSRFDRSIECLDTAPDEQRFNALLQEALDL